MTYSKYVIINSMHIRAIAICLQLPLPRHTILQMTLLRTPTSTTAGTTHYSYVALEKCTALRCKRCAKNGPAFSSTPTAHGRARSTTEQCTRLLLGGLIIPRERSAYHLRLLLLPLPFGGPLSLPWPFAGRS